MYIYTYVSIYIYIHIYTYIYVYAHAYICVRVYVCVHIYTSFARCMSITATAIGRMDTRCLLA